MLESMDNFVLDVSGTGKVVVSVGLDPDTVGQNPNDWRVTS